MKNFRLSLKSSRTKIIALGVLLLTLIAPIQFFNNIIPVSTENFPPEQNENDNKVYSIESPQSSLLSGNPWWNKSFHYRRLINITNLNPTNLVNQGVNLTFNYRALVDAGRMNSSLKDIRIVENGVLRKYYFKKDFPLDTNATIWFETNISASTTEYDTFLYYGNNSVNIEYNYFIDERFGLHWYPFDDGPGSSVAKDLGTGTVADATLYPSGATGPKWVSGKLGSYAIEFNSSNYVSASPGNDITTGKVSLSFWVYLKSGSNTAVRKQSAAYLIEFGINEDNSLGSNPQMYVSTPGGSYYIWWPTTIAYNQWYHIVGTYDATQAKMYINGANVVVTVRSGSASGPMIDSTGSFQIGSWPGETFVGIIDDARLFNFDLSSEEIQWIYSFNRTSISLKLNEEQQVNASVKVTAKDLNNNLISYGKISIYNTTFSSQTKIAGIDGSVTFENLKMGQYNFSVKIESSVNPAIWELVNVTSTPFLLNKVSNEIILVCRVNTHTFTVNDVDGTPVESGWIVVGNTTNGFGEIQNCTINSNGQAKFWWVNCSPYRYNYTVYYRSDMYNPKVIKLANGTINAPSIIPIIVKTNLTTVNFTILAEPPTLDPVSGAKLILRKYNETGVSIVNLTTISGKATLRWVNSSGLTPGNNVNYSIQVDFFGLKTFNITIGESWPPDHDEFNFSVKAKCMYELRININPSAYQTELISLNPSDPIQIKWGSLLTIRYLFNISKVGTSKELLGPTYADSMIYQVKYGTTEILSGSLSPELGNIGRYHTTIDTLGLEGGKSYTVEISAQKSGYSSPIPKSIGLIILKNDMQLNQSENNDATKTVYWQENTNMTVKSYGQISESIVVRDSIFKQNNSNDYNFNLWIPNLSNDWNLSQITFDISNIEWNVDASQINITFIDPYNRFNMWHISNYTAYGSTFSYSGHWVKGITFNIGKDSPTQDNNFKFFINGSFDGTVDIVATASYVRNKINVEYSKYNMTNSISILSDFNGWVIKNISFEISNCRDSSWNLVNPADNIDNITTNDGRVYDYITGDSSGNGRININDTIIYPVNYQYLFNIGNNSKISFDARIKVEYIQGFYQNNLLEFLNLTINRQNYVKGGDFIVNVNSNIWKDQGAILLVNNLRTDAGNVVPSQVGLRIIVGGRTYYFDDFSSLTLSDLTKNTILPAIIRANQKVYFDLSFAVTYSRDVSYNTVGTVTYQIREAPDITGTVQYYPVSGYYLQTINTSLINAGEYTIRFTVSKENYFSATKDLKLIVLNRLTKINGSTQFYKITSNIYVKDSVDYMFKYTDAATGAIIMNLKTQHYIWEQYDDEGNAIDNGTGTLITTSNNLYLLDVNTSELEVGDYLIVVTLVKENYDSKNAMISLTVKKRLIGISLNNNSIQINVAKGSTAIIEFDLIDSTRGHITLTGATVILTISGQTFRFKETKPGHYKCELSTDNYSSFFIPLTITGNISISKEDYISEKLSVTIVIGMDEWPIPGFPAFYFLMIVIGIVAVVSSLATYRYIQLTQIPTFVKKARAMKKAIKGSELISESLLYPSKEEFTLKKYGDKWEFLGISLESVLGIDRKKMEVTPELKKEQKPSIGKKTRNLYDNIKEKVKKIELKKKKEEVKRGET